MSSQAKSGLLVVCIGNPLRGDDAVACIVARQLRERNVPAIRVLEHDGEGTSLIEVWKGEHNVIVIDSMCSHAEPGSIHTFDAAHRLPGKPMFLSSTHAFGLREALQLAQSLFQLPPRLIIYGIEGKSFGIGEPPSAEAQAGAARLGDRILQQVELESRSSNLRDEP
jgi:hydrogenase maturation protease